jgi:hypothetical protein
MARRHKETSPAVNRAGDLLNGDMRGGSRAAFIAGFARDVNAAARAARRGLVRYGIT